MAQTPTLGGEARNHGVMAGEWAKQNELRQYGSPRSRIRANVVPLVGCQNPSANPTGRHLRGRGVLIACIPRRFSREPTSEDIWCARNFPSTASRAEPSILRSHERQLNPVKTETVRFLSGIPLSVPIPIWSGEI